MTKKRTSPNSPAAESSAADSGSVHLLNWEDRVTEGEFAEALALFERAARAGSGEAILDALEWCASAQRAAPPWLAELFAQRWWNYQCFEVRTLDEAFGLKRPESLNLPAAKRELFIAGDAVRRYDDLKSGGENSESARAKVAAEFNISDSLVKKYLAKSAARQRSQAARSSAQSIIDRALSEALRPLKSSLTRKSKNRDRDSGTNSQKK